MVRYINKNKIITLPKIMNIVPIIIVSIIIITFMFNNTMNNEIILSSYLIPTFVFTVMHLIAIKRIITINDDSIEIVESNLLFKKKKLITILNIKNIEMSYGHGGGNAKGGSAILTELDGTYHILSISDLGTKKSINDNILLVDNLNASLFKQP